MSEPEKLNIAARLALVQEREPLVLDNVLYFRDRSVAEWIQKKFGQPLLAVPFRALGVLRDGDTSGSSEFIAAAYFVNHYDDPMFGEDISICVCSDQPMTAAKPHVLNRVFDYAFATLDLPRVSAEINEINKEMLDIAYSLGFQLEGRKRKSGPGGTDRLVLGLLRDDAKALGIWTPDPAKTKLVA